jgi:hypothetical protein
MQLLIKKIIIDKHKKVSDNKKITFSDYIAYPFVAYTVIDNEFFVMDTEVLTFALIIEDSSVLTSLGYPVNLGGGESYKWLIQFEESKFIKLAFTDVNFNTYKVISRKN